MGPGGGFRNSPPRPAGRAALCAGARREPSWTAAAAVGGPRPGERVGARGAHRLQAWAGCPSSSIRSHGRLGGIVSPRWSLYFHSDFYILVLHQRPSHWVFFPCLKAPAFPATLESPEAGGPSPACSLAWGSGRAWPRWGLAEGGLGEEGQGRGGARGPSHVGGEALELGPPRPPPPPPRVQTLPSAPPAPTHVRGPLSSPPSRAPRDGPLSPGPLPGPKRNSLAPYPGFSSALVRGPLFYAGGSRWLSGWGRASPPCPPCSGARRSRRTWPLRGVRRETRGSGRRRSAPPKFCGELRSARVGTGRRGREPQRRWEGGTHGSCECRAWAERTGGLKGSPGSITTFRRYLRILWEEMGTRASCKHLDHFD
ncbi:uncharacterized protein LOC118143578 [Callithrix jacchus]|uniref:translation initiation factor IF-2-like n=1 Tax=Callithrix jacchus TaxID=9483 RepID=UPI00159DE1A3|nr:translation initiation factor IF-2-like [Callithrix jacchus]